MWRQELRWMRCVVRAQDRELRLDRWLRNQFPTLPQSFLQTQLRKRRIRLQQPDAAPSQHKTRANSLLSEGCVVAVDAHLFQSILQPISKQLQPSTHELTTAEELENLQRLMQRVVFQDEHFVVLNKPHGLAVQDGSALSESLAKYLPSMAQSLRGRGSELQELKLVHRLDKETSGVLVLARSRLAAAKFSELLRNGAVHKIYEALVASECGGYDRLKRFEGKEINFSVDNKPACTLVKRVLRRSNSTEPNGMWLQLSPRTGRKHQLRVHCSQELRAPIVGDGKYGGRSADRLHLHAKRIRFPHPFTMGLWIDLSVLRT